MKALLIVQKNNKKYGYVLAAKANMSREVFINILHKTFEGYAIVTLDVK